MSTETDRPAGDLAVTAGGRVVTLAPGWRAIPPEAPEGPEAPTEDRVVFLAGRGHVRIVGDQ